MAAPATGLPHGHQTVVERFVAACRADERVVAAFLGGSYAGGTADAYSDLDLYLVTTDEAYDDFCAGRAAFVALLGEPVFLETFSDFGFDLLLFVFAGGVEGELGLGRAGSFKQIHGGPHRVLVDKAGILQGVGFPLHKVDPTEQAETLRGLLVWFWHNLSHFITALGRGELWAAYGALDDLRLACVNLARQEHDFSAPADGYEKVDRALPLERLAPLQATCCPLEAGAMLEAARRVVGYYREVAPRLAAGRGVAYPAGVERVMLGRMETLSQRRL